MANSKYSIVLLMAITVLSGCVTQRKLTYFNNVDTASIAIKQQPGTYLLDPEIKPGDALLITVTALDMTAVAPFNLPAVVMNTSRTAQVATTPTLQSYSVAPDGTIDFPVFGKIQAAGLRKSEFKLMLERMLAPHVTDPIVIITFVNASVTVMGEVNMPGRVPIRDEKLTIMDALAGAGDLTPFGKRNNVLIMREEDGQMKFARVNLNDANIINSPYYFLRQNDVVYISPNRVKAENSQNWSLGLGMISTIASAATVIVTVITATK